MGNKTSNMEILSAIEVEQTQRQQSFEYITLLRVIGAFAVIGIHVVCSPVSLTGQTYSIFDLMVSVFITNALRLFAVPIFIMISGALFLNPNKDFELSKFLRKNVSRVLLALFLFAFIFCAMEAVFIAKRISFKILVTILKNTIEGESWEHMWFLYMLPGLYLFVPLLRTFTKNSTDKEFKFTLTVLFIFLSLFPTITSIFNIKIGITIPITSIYFFYFLIGFGISSRNLFNSLKLCIVLIFLPLLFILIELFIPNTISFNGATIKYTSLNDIAAVSISIGIFSLAKNFYKKRCSPIINFIAQNSFGIYLLHTIPINVCYKVLKFSSGKMNLYLMLIICYILAFGFSLITTWLLRKIPFIKKYIL